MKLKSANNLKFHKIVSTLCQSYAIFKPFFGGYDIGIYLLC